jgi:flagellar FliL protein
MKRVTSLLMYLGITFCLLAAPQLSHAQEDMRPSTFAYVGLEPDIVTNYAGDNSQKLGYVRVTIEMMVADPSKIIDIEHHMPLLRATAIEVLGAQSEDNET